MDTIPPHKRYLHRWGIERALRMSNIPENLIIYAERECEWDENQLFLYDMKPFHPPPRCIKPRCEHRLTPTTFSYVSSPIVSLFGILLRWGVIIFGKLMNTVFLKDHFQRNSRNNLRFQDRSQEGSNYFPEEMFLLSFGILRTLFLGFFKMAHLQIWSLSIRSSFRCKVWIEIVFLIMTRKFCWWNSFRIYFQEIAAWNREFESIQKKRRKDA